MNCNHGMHVPEPELPIIEKLVHAKTTKCKVNELQSWFEISFRTRVSIPIRMRLIGTKFQIWTRCWIMGKTSPKHGFYIPGGTNQKGARTELIYNRQEVHV